jgi:hypothetical protein
MLYTPYLYIVFGGFCEWLKWRKSMNILLEKIEDTEGVIKSSKSKKNRQHTSQKMYFDLHPSSCFSCSLTSHAVNIYNTIFG